MNPSLSWSLFIARPGNERRHVIRDPQGEPRLIFGDDDGTRINDHLARYIVEGLNADLRPADPNPDEGRFLECRGSDEEDSAVLVCDPDFDIRLEILDTENGEADQALGRRIVALINTYFALREGAHPSASSSQLPPGKPQTGSGR